MTYSSENPTTETFGGGAEGWHSGGAAGPDSTTGAESQGHALKPDFDQATGFLRLLDPSAETFTFQTFTDRKGKPSPDPLARVLNGSFDEHADTLADLNRRGAGVYVTVNETDGSGRQKENIVRIRALWQEADRGDEPTLPVEPHMIVESSPGKFHQYVLVEGAPLDEFEPVQLRLVDDYGSDPNAKDRSRVLRLPGFYHQKDPSHPHLVHLVHESGQSPMVWKEAVKYFPPVRREQQYSSELPPEGTPLANAPEVRSALNALAPDIGFQDWLRIGMALHSTGAGLEAFQLWDDWSAAGALYKEGECAYRWRTFTRDRAVAVLLNTLFWYARKAGWAGRTYDEMLADAEGMDANTPPAAVEALIVESMRLPPVQRERILLAIKGATGTPMGALRRAAAAALKDTEADELDHLGLARSVVQSVGAENIIGTQSHVWRYQDTGVWRPLEPRAEKHTVQTHLDTVHAEQTITKGLVDSVTETLKNEVYRPGHEWDVGPTDAVVVKNGELVLRDGQWHLGPHRREFYRTVLVPVEHDPRATAPRFEQFLGEVFKPDADWRAKRTAILEMIGYTLMTHSKYERFVLMPGNGANGKSKLLAVVEALAGRDNVAGVQPSEFDNKFQRAHMHLKLANIVTEIKQGEVIADAALKSIVSGERTTVENKFQSPFEFRPYATCWFGTNHLPHTRDFSDALFRRAMVVPFNRKFVEGVDADPDLAEKLTEELPGILTLALNAYAKVVKRGAFTEPPSCVQAKKEWRMEADQAAQFLEECCTPGPTREPSGEVYAEFREWADGSGIRNRLSQKTLTMRLETLGFGTQKSGDVRFITGLRLNNHGGYHRGGFRSDAPAGGEETDAWLQ